MCGRFTLTADFQRIIDRFDINVALKEEEYNVNYNTAPTDLVLSVINDGQHNRLGYFKWGLIPAWSKDEKVGSKMINARSESVEVKPSFKHAFQKRRCLVIADSFYEWKKTQHGKVPYRIKLKSDELFAMAGIWEGWKSLDGEMRYTCSILTTQSNQVMAPIHDRMPVILKPDAEKIWLDPSLKDSEKLKKLLVPYPDNQLEAYQVSQKVNSPKNNSLELIQKAE